LELCKTITLKKLILIRHAKSSWDYDVKDLDRPLSNRGFNDADLMSNILNNFSIKIDGVFSSNAKRTLQTANIFIKNLTNYKKLFIVESSDLYDFSGENVDLYIKNLKNDLDTVLVFSHNNSCNNLIRKYSNISDKHVPTCGILIFEFDVSLWSEVRSGNCKSYFPKNFK